MFHARFDRTISMNADDRDALYGVLKNDLDFLASVERMEYSVRIRVGYEHESESNVNTRVVKENGRVVLYAYNARMI